MGSRRARTRALCSPSVANSSWSEIRSSFEHLPDGSLEDELERRRGHRAAERAVDCWVPMDAPPRCRRTLLSTAFEATTIPPSWMAPSLRYDGVIVPTPSSASSFAAAGFPAARLHVCPLGVDATFRPGVPPYPLADGSGRALADYRVRFLTVATAVPRKNLTGLLRTWIRATRRGDDAVLILKLGELSHASVPSFLRALAAVEASVGKRRSEAAKIVWHTDVLPDALMPSFFALASHYVSLSHGEGWDLPMMQAGAMGLRLIAPFHSAYRDNLDETSARLVPARRVPAMRDLGAAERCILEIAPWSVEHFGHAEWWQPDEEAAAAVLREAIDHPEGAWPTAPERFQRRTWEASTERLLEIVDA